LIPSAKIEAGKLEILETNLENQKNETNPFIKNILPVTLLL